MLFAVLCVACARDRVIQCDARHICHEIAPTPEPTPTIDPANTYPHAHYVGTIDGCRAFIAYVPDSDTYARFFVHCPDGHAIGTSTIVHHGKVSHAPIETIGNQ